MKRIKVLHLLLSLNVGGAERVAASIVTGSDPARFEHEVCCLDEIGVFGEDLARQGFRTTLLRRKSGVDWPLILRLTVFMRCHKIDIVHAHGETPWFYGALASALTFWRSKCITTVHGYGGGNRTRMDDYRLWKVLTRLSQKVVLVAENLRQELIENDLPKGKLETIINGVDFQKIEKSSKECRESWGINGTDLIIGIVARLSAVKNHYLLLQALSNLKKDGSCANIKLAIVGDGPERFNLEEKVSQLNLSGSVIFFGAQNAALSFYNLFDIFVLPSFSEGISMTLLEALACKVPVVASRVGGNAEVVKHGETGILFESGDLYGLSQSILDLSLNPTRRKQLAKAGYLRVNEQYSFEVMVESYNRLYAGIIG